MRTILMSACLFVAASHGFAQLDSDTVTVTAIRTPSGVVDEVYATVYVTTELNSTLDRVLAALQTTGITAANLATVYSFGPQTDWTFTLSGPYSKLKDTLAAVSRVPSTSNISVSYSVQAGSPAASTCAWPALLSDAQAEAQRLAAAAGVNVGPILALSDERAGIPQTVVSASGLRFGDFTQTVIGVIGAFPLPRLPAFMPPIISAPNCALTVQFKLLR